jgi:hypothetical protein
VDGADQHAGCLLAIIGGSYAYIPISAANVAMGDKVPDVIMMLRAPTAAARSSFIAYSDEKHQKLMPGSAK